MMSNYDMYKLKEASDSLYFAILDSLEVEDIDKAIYDSLQDYDLKLKHPLDKLLELHLLLIKEVTLG